MRILPQPHYWYDSTNHILIEPLRPCRSPTGDLDRFIMHCWQPVDQLIQRLPGHTQAVTKSGDDSGRNV